MPYCIRCGNRISDLAVACPKCGTPNARRVASTPATPGVPVDVVGSAPQLRPLGVGEIIDVSIKLYRAHALTLLKLVAMVVVPVQIVTAFILTSATPDSPTTFQQSPLDPTAPPIPQVDTSALWALGAGFLITTVLGLLATQLATAASLKAVSDGYLNRKPDWRESISFAFGRFGSLIWLAILSSFLVAIGILLCIIPGIYLSVAWAVAVPVLLIERTRGYGALERSRQLVRGRWWPVLGVLALGRIIATVLEFAFGLGLGLISFTSDSEVVVFFTQAISTSLSQTIVTPFLAATIAIMYFDLRVRKEGFDLELLAQNFGSLPPLAPGEPAASPAAPDRGAAPASPQTDIAPGPPQPPPRRRPTRPGFQPPTDTGQEPTDEGPPTGGR